ncbi:MAG: SH3 domain-containing protein [Oscillospiraceae bacterium]|nr:SH3 domain-containing protein [Oscillospiraceae bacterium]
MRRIRTYILSLILLAGILLLPNTVRAAAADAAAGTVTTAGSRLNIRIGPSVASSAVSSLNNGSYVTLLSKSGDWWQVSYGKDLQGYCHADYITPVPSAVASVNTQSSNLNIRSGAGTVYSRIGSLYKGEQVVVLSSSSAWSRILYHGTKTGYVSARYLSAISNYPPVSLSVPNFKQTDGRWANVTVGSSGKPLSQIGCATTAIAMLESYRTGTTIYPDAMSRRLSYTATGNVYWPGHYAVVTDSTAYLSRIYSLLSQGKPVLFGARNAYGKQHWVVITGYTGGDTLTASGFTVHDPGSSSRTNLQQLLNLYPKFYKYFYY